MSETGKRDSLPSIYKDVQNLESSDSQILSNDGRMPQDLRASQNQHLTSQPISTFGRKSMESEGKDNWDHESKSSEDDEKSESKENGKQTKKSSFARPRKFEEVKVYPSEKFERESTDPLLK